MDTNIIEGGVNAMAEIFTAVGTCLTSITGMASDILVWAVQEPLILVGLTLSIAGGAIGLFGSAKGAARA